MNASSFAFRDLNRNGVYDLHDRPMANVAFVGRGPDGWTKLVRTNIDGFSNFRMSATRPNSPFLSATSIMSAALVSTVATVTPPSRSASMRACRPRKSA